MSRILLLLQQLTQHMKWLIGWRRVDWRQMGIDRRGAGVKRHQLTRRHARRRRCRIRTNETMCMARAQKEI